MVGGVGSLYRCKPDGTARVYAHVLLILVDKSGSEISERYGAQSESILKLDLPCDVAQLQAPPSPRVCYRRCKGSCVSRWRARRSAWGIEKPSHLGQK